jgi:hypothetical protein
MYEFASFSKAITFVLQEIQQRLIAVYQLHEIHKKGLHGGPASPQFPENTIA